VGVRAFLVPAARTVPGSLTHPLTLSTRKLTTVPPLPSPATPAPRRAFRVAAAATAAAGLLIGATGCAKFDAALGQQEAVVHFRDGTPNATRLKVRAACSHLPQAKAEPLPTDHKASDLLYDVRYRVDHASDADLARLDQCLQRFPSVDGLDVQSPTGS
jgi:hypothetical protein